ncbi:Na(+)/dicarboxylate cotransporter 3-like isoform X2 [Ptychodera flava]|uniref:Na(+)/dicarboxylate cotransporter 3-like isoform X2 n=2 Tax=Ptychodera flava TaxID=63121 RepID=UPI00396A91E7
MVQNRAFRLLLVNRGLLITFVTPLVFAPIPIVYQTSASKCLYIFLIMLVYTLSEALPLAIVGLLPSMAFPLLGIMDAATLGEAYFSDQLLFMIGVLTIAKAVERTDLHKRIVLRGLLIFGSSPYGILFGVFVISGFLSMWLPNMALVSMMLPIGEALGEELDKQYSRPDMKTETEELRVLKANEDIVENGNAVNVPKNLVAAEDKVEKDGTEGRGGNDVRKKSALTTILLLTIVYGNTIGGTATLIGTLLPILANAQLLRFYGPRSVIEFDLWIQFGFPLQLASLLCAYVWMAFLMTRTLKTMRTAKRNSSTVESAAYQGNGSHKSTHESDNVRLAIKREYAKLGGLKWSEAVTIILILAYILLLFFADLKFMKGWKSLFPKGYTSNTCITSGLAILFFIIPLERPNCRTPSDTGKLKTVLEWDYVSRKLPWGLLLITGGYFALAEAIQDSGISGSIEEYFRYYFADQESWVIVLALTVVLAAMTELIGNIPVWMVTFPILASLARATSTNPLFYVIPSVFAVNLTFMLPISGVPFMLVYTAGVKLGDIVKTGWVMNIICLFLLNLFVNTFGYIIFDFGTVPSWALPDNSTASIP